MNVGIVVRNCGKHHEILLELILVPANIIEEKNLVPVMHEATPSEKYHR